MKPEDLYDKVDRLTSRDGWVADTQTKGRMLENLVRELIEHLLPPGRNLRVATGCVWDGHSRGDLPQSDLIIFENRPNAVLYDSHDVVVVHSAVVRAIVSVKTNLSKQDVDTEIPDYRDLLRKQPRTLLIFFAAAAEPIRRETANAWLHGNPAKAQVRIVCARWGTSALGPRSRRPLTPNTKVFEELSEAIHTVAT